MNAIALENSDSNEELLARVAHRDRDAFSTLYDVTSARVFGLAVRTLRNRELAEEAVQEVYTTVWTQAHAYDAGRGLALSWLLTICHRRCVDVIRREETRKRKERGEAVVAEPDVAENVVNAVAARQVHDALKTVSVKQQEVIESMYFRGKTLQETAKNLNCSPSTVKTRLRDGLMKLRKEMDNV